MGILRGSCAVQRAWHHLVIADARQSVQRMVRILIITVGDDDAAIPAGRATENRAQPNRRCASTKLRNPVRWARNASGGDARLCVVSTETGRATPSSGLAFCLARIIH
jgi:hypothetical protein